MNTTDTVPNDVDVYVGARVRQRRTLLRISQEKLGGHIGVTFQQIQKYEKGANRIGAGQLFLIANYLKVDVNYFYEGLNGAANGFSEASAPFENVSAEGHVLNRAFARISSAEVRNRLIQLVSAIADGADDGMS